MQERKLRCDECGKTARWSRFGLLCFRHYKAFAEGSIRIRTNGRDVTMLPLQPRIINGQEFMVKICPPDAAYGSQRSAPRSTVKQKAVHGSGKEVGRIMRNIK